LAGEAWARRVESAIQEPNIFVLLVSPDFLASEYSSRIELELIFEQAPTGAQIIPVLVRPVIISEKHRLRQLKWLPKNNIPISEQEDTDEAWVEVSDAIRQVAQRMRR
jgi:hypothetical protein